MAEPRPSALFHGMRRILSIALAPALLCAMDAPHSRPDLDISAQSPSFQALRRVQSRAQSLYYDQVFPQSSAGMATYLDAQRLSAFDSASTLGRYPFGSDELVRWVDADRGNSFFLSPLLELGAISGNASDTLGTRDYGGLGARIYGKVGTRLSFYTHATMYTEKTEKAQFSHQFNPGYGETYTVEKGPGDSLLKSRTYNRFEYYAKLDYAWGSIKAGRDWIHMGPGYFSSLTATRDTPPYYLLEARIDFAPWLKLDNYLLKMTDTDYGIQKYANLHRFEFKPLPSLALAFEDIVIYQDRDPDPTYLLPLVPLTFSEANGGGRDNAAMSFDAMYAAPHGVSVWGELFLDDLLGPASFFDDFWENRWAVLAGFQWSMPLTWADADLVVEYSRVEPWTYNGRKPQTSFRQFNVPSASKLGPDSRTWDAQLSYRPSRWVEFKERLGLYDKGQGRPGELGAIHDDSLDGTSKAFLGQAVRSQRIWEQEIGYLYSRYVSGRLAWARDFGDVEDDSFAAELRLAW
jgi:hypothetical protein